MKCTHLFLWILLILATECDAQHDDLIFAHDTLRLIPGDSVMFVIGDKLNAELRYERFHNVRVSQNESQLKSFGKGRAIVENGYVVEHAFYFPNGAKDWEWKYAPDSAYWESRRWNEEGVILKEGVGDMNHEYWKYYYSNGSIESEGKFVPDSTTSDFTLITCWSILDFECTHSSSYAPSWVPDGDWKFYDYNGLMKVISFSKGKVMALAVGDYMPKH